MRSKWLVLRSHMECELLGERKKTTVKTTNNLSKLFWTFNDK